VWLVLPLNVDDSLSVGGPAVASSPVLPPQTQRGWATLLERLPNDVFRRGRGMQASWRRAPPRTRVPCPLLMWFESLTSLASVIPLRGGPLILFSLQLLCLKLNRSGVILHLCRVPQAGKDASLSGDVPLQHGLMQLKMMMTGTKTRHFLMGAFQDQALSGRFVLPLGGFWESFGFLLREGLPSGRPRGSLWAPFGPWTPPSPVWKPRAASASPSPSLILDST
jgi:hypothetical protein